MKIDEETMLLTMGLVVLAAFTFIISINLLPNDEFGTSNLVGMAGRPIDNWQVNNPNEVTNHMNANIESIEVKNNVLEIVVSGYAVAYCVKTTRSTPSPRSLCWEDKPNDTTLAPVLSGRKYYVWIKDTTNNVSTPWSIKT